METLTAHVLRSEAEVETPLWLPLQDCAPAAFIPPASAGSRLVGQASRRTPPGTAASPFLPHLVWGDIGDVGKFTVFGRGWYELSEA